MDTNSAPYRTGFMAKIAELEAQGLIKEAGRGDMLAKGLRQVGKDKLLESVPARSGAFTSFVRPSGTELADNLSSQAGQDAGLAKYLGRKGKPQAMNVSTGMSATPNAPQTGGINLAELATKVREKLLARKTSDRLAGRAVMKGIKHPNA